MKNNDDFLFTKYFRIFQEFFKNFRRSFLWPGYGENSRVLKWICERIDGTGKVRTTPIGYVPTYRALDTSGLNISKEVIFKLLNVDNEEWLREIPEIKKFYSKFGDK